MNVLILKLIALTTMIIDHYGAIFQGDVALYRIIGRLAFPIYCFLLVEGYFHTKDVKKYAQRLLLFALISEIPFDLAFYGKVGFTHQNIFFTLFIGLATIFVLENKEEKYNFNKSAVLFVAGILAIVFSVDYNIIGIIYILAFYFTRNLPMLKKFPALAFILFITNIVSASPTQQYALLALPIIFLYNGKLGPKNKPLQMLFYSAYPLHLLIFYIIKIIK